MRRRKKISKYNFIKVFRIFIQDELLDSFLGFCCVYFSLCSIVIQSAAVDHLVAACFSLAVIIIIAVAADTASFDRHHCHLQFNLWANHFRKSKSFNLLSTSSQIGTTFQPDEHIKTIVLCGNVTFSTEIILYLELIFGMFQKPSKRTTTTAIFGLPERIHTHIHSNEKFCWHLTG